MSHDERLAKVEEHTSGRVGVRADRRHQLFYRAHRSLLWAAALACGALVAAGVFLWTVPLTSPRLAARIAAGIGEATGLKVAIGSARLYLGQARCTMENVRLHDLDGSDEPLLAIKSLDASLSWLALATGRRQFVRMLTVSEPSGLEFEWGPEGFAPRGATARLITALRTRQAPAETGRDPLFQSLRMRDARMTLHVGSRDAYHADLTDALVTARGNNISLDISGIIRGPQSECPFGAYASAANGFLTALEIRAPKALLGGPLAPVPDGSLAAESLEASLRVGAGEKGREGRLTLTAASLQASSPAAGIEFAERNLRLESVFAFSDPATSPTLELESLSAAGDALNVNAAGTVALVPPYTYDISVDADRLGLPWLKLAMRYLPREWHVKVPEDGLSSSFSVAGDQSGVALIVGSLPLAGTEVISDLTPYPVAIESGELNFEPRRLVLHNMSGRFGQAQVSVSGVFEGQYMARREGKLSLSWSARATPDDLLAFLASKPEKVRRGKGSATSPGRIESTGTLSQFVSLTDPSRTEPPDIDGEVVLDRVGFSHPSLRVPMENLCGRLTIRDSVIDISGLSGRAGGNDITVRGRVEGKQYFWRQPRLRATATARTNIHDLFDSLPAEVQAALVRHRVTGRGDLGVEVDGRLDDLAEARVTGRLEIHEASFDPLSPHLAGMVTGIEGVVVFDGRRVRVSHAQGVLNGETIFATASADPSSLEVTLKGTPDMGFFPATFNGLRGWTEMSGPAQIEMTFAVASPAPLVRSEPAAGGGSADVIAALAQGWAARVAEAVAARDYRLAGTVDFRGVRIRHNSMPPAKTDAAGRSIPAADISGIRGRARIDGTRLVMDAPLACAFADTPNCQLTGFLEYRPGQFPRMQLDLTVAGEARFDPWILGWGRQIQTLREQGILGPIRPGLPKKTFELNGSVRARSGQYKGQTCGPLSFDISYTFTRDEPYRLVISGGRLQREGGSLTADAQLTQIPGSPDSPEWTLSSNLRDMRILPLAIWVFSDVRNIDGIITGRIDIRGRGSNPAATNGSGSAAMRQLELSRVPLVTRLGQRTRLNFQGRFFETASAANWTIRDGVLASRDLQLETQGLAMTMRGTYSFVRKTIDAMVRLSILESTIGVVTDNLRVPILSDLAGDLLRFADRQFGNLLLAFRVSGPAADPVVEPIPLPLFTQ
ncbi:MAG: DUF3971 domain-containing protein [Candidatus Sumerlaeaceae bacterium]|nr:DUF3971 domain-containing protein [Candidatus Sumerlaeaceae bacterium]